MAEQTLLKVKGIVTRAVNYKENDKILTVLTDELGLISVHCYGAKSSKSKFLISCRLFCYSEFVLMHKKGFYYVKDADYIEAFYDIVNSIDKLFLGQYFLDVINEISVEGESHESLLRLLLNSLYALSKNVASDILVKSVFELRACVEMGVSPDLKVCRNCGVEKHEQFYFDVLNGNVICKDCLLSGKNSVEITQTGLYFPVTMSVLSAMKYIQNARIERLFSFTLSEDMLESFSTVCEKYLLNQVGKSFKTLELYNEQIR